MGFFREINRGHIVKCKHITNFTRFSGNREMWGFFREINRGHIVKWKHITNFARFSGNREKNLRNQKRRVYEHF